YEVQTMDPVALLTAEGQPPPMAVIAATDAPTLQRLSTKFAPAGVAVLNLTADDEALRQACRPNLLHIAPSAGMKADAVAQWQKKRPTAPVQARAWHAEDTKFSAAELNHRVRQGDPVAMVVA